MEGIGESLIYRILSENRIKEFGTLNSKWFVIPSERELWKKVKDYNDKYGRLPSPEVFGVSEVAGEYGHYLNEFIERGIKYDLSRLSETISSKINKEGAQAAFSEIKKFVDETESQLSKATNKYITLRDLKQLLREYIEEGRLKGEELIGIPSGWPTLDEMSGGFQKGDIITIVARPGSGKSESLVVLSHMAHKFGKKIVIFTMEMTALQFGKRLASFSSKIPGNTLKYGKVSSEAEEQLFSSLPDSDDYVIIEGQLAKDISEIISIIQDIKPDIVYIDAAYLIKKKYVTDRSAIIEGVMNDIKQVSLQCKIPIVDSFQLNREATKSKVRDLSHIYMSDSVGQISSIVMGIYDAEDPKEKIFQILKGREGEYGFFKVHWNFETMNFSEILEEKYE